MAGDMGDYDEGSACEFRWKGLHGETHECDLPSHPAEDTTRRHMCMCGKDHENAPDTTNDFAVGAQGVLLVMNLPPGSRARFSRAQAYRLAAWLVVLCGDDEERFREVLTAVRAV